MGDLNDEIEPLEPELWLAALARLAQRQIKAAESEVESLLRHSFHLLQLAPRPLKGMVRCELDEKAFESLLECGAFDSAAVALVAQPAGFELYCLPGSPEHVVEASVSLPGQSGPPGIASGAGIASALVGAWASCLASLMQQSAGDLPIRPIPRKPRAESRLRSNGR
jgi:hypothetical protein